MKFKFKIQKFQTDAVDSIVSVFEGQPFIDKSRYTRDIGVVKKEPKQGSLFEYEEESTENVVGFENAKIQLSDYDLLENIHKVQTENNLKLSAKLVNDLGRCGLDIEMETGTGKTYVYIKSIFELNKRYGWSKFIIVVPSIAIREGVKKSFEMTQEHFMEYYGKKARSFIYNSGHLNDLDSFSSNSSINVMIINSQAFNAFSEDGTEGKHIAIVHSKTPMLCISDRFCIIENTLDSDFLYSYVPISPKTALFLVKSKYYIDEGAFENTKIRFGKSYGCGKPDPYLSFLLGCYKDYDVENSLFCSYYRVQSCVHVKRTFITRNKANLVTINISELPKEIFRQYNSIFCEDGTKILFCNKKELEFALKHKLNCRKIECSM